MNTEIQKPIHVKPSFYSYCFQPLKEIALKYGYNLVLHGSMNRDMDLIAIRWVEETGDVEAMIIEFGEYLNGDVFRDAETGNPIAKIAPHGRKQYIINMNRGSIGKDGCWSKTDPLYYLDISVI